MIFIACLLACLLAWRTAKTHSNKVASFAQDKHAQPPRLLEGYGKVLHGLTRLLWRSRWNFAGVLGDKKIIKNKKRTPQCGRHAQLAQFLNELIDCLDLITEHLFENQFRRSS